MLDNFPRADQVARCRTYSNRFMANSTSETETFRSLWARSPSSGQISLNANLHLIVSLMRQLFVGVSFFIDANLINLPSFTTVFSIKSDDLPRDPIVFTFDGFCFMVNS